MRSTQTIVVNDYLLFECWQCKLQKIGPNFGYTVGFKIITKIDENVVILLSMFKTYILGWQSVQQI